MRRTMMPQAGHGHAAGGKTLKNNLWENLQRLSSTQASHLAEPDDDQQMDPKLREEWHRKSLRDNVTLGSKTLLMMHVCMMMSRFGMLIYYHWNGCHFERKGRAMLTHWLAQACEWTWFISACVILRGLRRRPVPWIYLTVVAFYFIYLLIVGVPPFYFNCHELMMCGARASVHDCATEGQTLMVALMCWVLISPRVIPKMWMMHFTWAWIWILWLAAEILFTPKEDRRAFVSRTVARLMLLNLSQCMALSKKYYIEKGQRSKFLYDLKQREASQKMFKILEDMVPHHVIPRMLRGDVIADEVNRVSILFVMFVDFDQKTQSMQPDDVLSFLNKYFTKFDEICHKHEVTKIETVGEEFVAAVGVVPADVAEDEERGHQGILGRLIRVAAEILQLQEHDDEVKVKMGIHTGPVVAGVIGHKLPRFRLFGDTINTAARMMQKGLPGELQFGEETYSELPDWAKKLAERRGEIEMKGKGHVTAYLLKQPKSSTTALPASSPAQPSGEAPAAPPQQQQKRASLSERLMELQGASSPAELEVATTGSQDAGPPAAGSSPQRVRVQAPGPREIELIELPAREDGQDGQLGNGDVGQELLQKGSGSPSSSSTAAARSSGQHRQTKVRRNFASGGGLGGWRADMEAFQQQEDEAEDWFDVVVQEVSVAEREILARSGEAAKKGKQKSLGDFGLGKVDFTPAMEKEFQQWYHESSVVKKLELRLEKQAAGLSVLTALEVLYTMTVTKAFTDSSHFMGAEARLPLFLLCRMACVLIIMAWKAVATARDWLVDSPHEAQGRILASYCVVAVLLFFSYDAIEVDQWDACLGGSNFTLLFVPVYHFLTTVHPLLFLHQCAFAVLAVGIILLSHISEEGGARAIFHNLQFTFLGGLLFIANSILNSFLAHSWERNARARFKAKLAVQTTHGRSQEILHTLMPVMVVEELRENPKGAEPQTHRYKLATIAQSDLCGFTKLASTLQPKEVVGFIEELFGLFDDLTDEFEIYKVETVGDAYIAGQGGPPLTFQNSPLSVLLFGLGMVRQTHEWSRQKGEKVSCRVGVHHGTCIGGIVGTEMQRYHLFGDLMTGVEVLESTAPEGKVQVSPAVKLAVEDQIRRQGLNKDVVIFEQRQEPHLQTSKGDIHEYSEVGGATYVVRSYAHLRSTLDAA